MASRSRSPDSSSATTPETITATAAEAATAAAFGSSPFADNAEQWPPRPSGTHAHQLHQLKHPQNPEGKGYTLQQLPAAAPAAAAAASGAGNQTLSSVVHRLQLLQGLDPSDLRPQELQQLIAAVGRLQQDLLMLTSGGEAAGSTRHNNHHNQQGQQQQHHQQHQQQEVQDQFHKQYQQHTSNPSEGPSAHLAPFEEGHAVAVTAADGIAPFSPSAKVSKLLHQNQPAAPAAAAAAPPRGIKHTSAFAAAAAGVKRKRNKLQGATAPSVASYGIANRSFATMRGSLAKISGSLDELMLLAQVAEAVDEVQHGARAAGAAGAGAAAAGPSSPAGQGSSSSRGTSEVDALATIVPSKTHQRQLGAAKGGGFVRSTAGGASRKGSGGSKVAGKARKQGAAAAPPIAAAVAATAGGGGDGQGLLKGLPSVSAKALTQSICEEVLSGLQESCRQLLLEGEEDLHQQQQKQQQQQQNQQREQQGQGLPARKVNSAGYDMSASSLGGESELQHSERRLLLLESLSSLARQLSGSTAKSESPAGVPAAAEVAGSLAAPTLASIASALKGVMTSVASAGAGGVEDTRGGGTGVPLLKQEATGEVVNWGLGQSNGNAGVGTGMGGREQEGRQGGGVDEKLVQVLRGIVNSRLNQELQLVLGMGMEEGEGVDAAAATDTAAAAKRDAAEGTGRKESDAKKDVLLFQAVTEKQKHVGQAKQQQQQVQQGEDQKGGGRDGRSTYPVPGEKQEMLKEQASKGIAAAPSANKGATGGMLDGEVGGPAAAAVGLVEAHVDAYGRAGSPVSPLSGAGAGKAGGLQLSASEVPPLPLKRRWRWAQEQAAAAEAEAAALAPTAVAAQAGVGSLGVKQQQQQQRSQKEEEQGPQAKKMRNDEQGKMCTGDEVMTEGEGQEEQQQQQKELQGMVGPTEVRCLGSAAL